ncbi:hypothetical protein DY052_06010 [Apilactobacillus timberlakei]|uniref:hypothetical protein n=1 Tax=Apilactobacillus timberlakei TaxID=2008380 RepID=UPI001126DB4B|nr:hypothetical protein [Apilactobacillus timberlakei]TPR14978.1 hypothetical protein DY052_06010 [Apilactobacillus timberlakei]
MPRVHLNERHFNSQKDPTLRESKDFAKFGFVKYIIYLSISLIVCYVAVNVLMNTIQTLVVTGVANGLLKIPDALVQGFKEIGTYLHNNNNYEVRRVTSNLTTFVGWINIFRWGLCLVLWIFSSIYFTRNYYVPISRNNQEYGDGRTALPKDVKKESLKVPDRFEFFEGQFGSINMHALNNRGIDNYRVKNELRPIEKALKFDSDHLDGKLKEHINKIILITFIAMFLIVLSIITWIYHAIF